MKLYALTLLLATIATWSLADAHNLRRYDVAESSEDSYDTLSDFSPVSESEDEPLDIELEDEDEDIIAADLEAFDEEFLNDMNSEDEDMIGEEDRITKHLNNLKVRFRCMQEYSCRINYVRSLCMAVPKCKQRLNHATEQYEAYTKFVKDNKCKVKKGKSRDECFWHAHCVALHHKSKMMAHYCMGFISYLHSNWYG